ncbi:MAG: peptide ABC transporter substrate-binding protein [Hyphomicrobiaceae bacterium]|nr:peptide ABC transporter substrate-binding protein [Hyphomicrobiaceae bacterium]
MDDNKLRKMIGDVKHGRMSRRAFIGRMAAVGLTAPLASQLLAFGGVAMAQSTFKYAPTKRGGGGALKSLLWQAPTLLNPHFAVGTKDQLAARIFYEPLANWDPDGNLVPILAAEIPSRENGGLAADGLSVVWKLKKDVTWHDGKPFTADDCVFNWEFSRDPGTGATTSGSYKDVKVEKVDSHTIKIIFAKPTPFWADAFVSSRGMIIPKHLYESYIGAKSREAPTNLTPVGTGPYKFVDFKPGDIVRGALNDKYHMPNRPHFDTIELKGGGDAVSAARAVLQTGEFDHAWNLQVEDEVLLKLEQGGKGKVVITEGGNIEMILLNNTDPWTEVDGERSSIKTKHPFLTDPAVRQAMALLVDRDSVQKFIYGRTGTATANFVNNPKKYRSPNTKYEFNIEKASKLLEDAGWKKGSDGIREKGGKKLKLVYQTSINQPRQKNQAIVKQACQKAGIDVELKSVTASVFFSSDVANPDTFTKFYTDIEMYTTTMPQPDPEVFLNQFRSTEVATKDNKWQGRNISRWRNEEYDKTYVAMQSELDPVKRAALIIKCNDLIVTNQATIPVVSRPGVAAVANTLAHYISGWDVENSFVHEWHRKA